MTARFVASGLVLLESSGSPGGELVSGAAASAAARFLNAAQPRWRRSLGSSLARLRLTLREALTVPGLACHQALRKRWIREQVRRELAQGARRVVVIGGGYDPLSVELSHEVPGLRLLELDHPGTQAAKRRALGELGLLEAIELAPLDLERASLSSALGQREDGDLRTVFVAEGLLMYFDPPQVQALIAELAQLAAPQSALLFTYMEPDPRGDLHYRSATPLARALLRARGEPLRWGCARTDLGAFLGELGWSLRVSEGAEELARRFDLPPRTRLACGECVAAAELG